MHPSSELRAELATLRAEVKALKAALNIGQEVAATRQVGVPRGAYRGQDGLLRKVTDGTVFISGPVASYEDRQRGAIAIAEAKADADRAKSREGCPYNYYRDQCGIVRHVKDGTVLTVNERAQIAAEAVGQAQAADHRAWKQASRLPTRPTKDDPSPEAFEEWNPTT